MKYNKLFHIGQAFRKNRFFPCIDFDFRAYNESMRIREKKRKRGICSVCECKRLSEIAQPLANDSDGISSDVLGSYTGIASDGSSPQQDADDL